MLARTVSQGNDASSWNTTPMPSGTSEVTGAPSTVARRGEAFDRGMRGHALRHRLELCERIGQRRGHARDQELGINHLAEAHRIELGWPGPDRQQALGHHRDLDRAAQGAADAREL